MFVLGRNVPAEQAAAPIVADSDPGRLLEELRAANRGGDVHLVGGPKTIETFHVPGALDRLELVVLPLFLGDGMRLTPPLSRDTELALQSERGCLVGRRSGGQRRCAGRPPCASAPVAQGRADTRARTPSPSRGCVR